MTRKSLWLVPVTAILIGSVVLGMNWVAGVEGPSVGLRVSAWWACRNVDRPTLLSSSKPWQLLYSWNEEGGIRKAQVSISNDGSAFVEVVRGNKEEEETQSLHLGKQTIEKIAKYVDRAGVACASTSVRDGNIVNDIGVFRIELRSSDFRRELIVDRCRAIKNAKGVPGLKFLIGSISPLATRAVSMGPEGAVATPGVCK
jgi:hypothetical protein